MLTKEFQKFIDEEDTYISALYSEDDKRSGILARTVKLAEETGEVSDAVLAHLNDQRKDKLEKRDPNTLALELADVVLVAALIAKSVNIDLKEALEEKTTKLRLRR